MELTFRPVEMAVCEEIVREPGVALCEHTVVV